MNWRHNIIPAAWTAVVGILCGIPGNSFPELSFWKLLRFDSMAHAFVFAVFSFLWAVAICKQRRTYKAWQAAPYLSAFAAIIYGVILEFMQYYVFVRRSAEWPDMVSDALGAAIGCGLFIAIYRSVFIEMKNGKFAAE